MQTTLAARAVIKAAYAAELKADDDMLPCTTRDVLLATQHPRIGACAPGACPPDPQCLGAMAPALPQADAYLRLAHIVRQVDAKRAAARAAEAGRDGAAVAAAAPALAAAHAAAARLLRTAAYHWVDLSSLFGALAT